MNPAVYRFGAFQLEVATRTLRRDGEPVALAAKAFDCIRHLIEQRDRAVGRDELIQVLWGHPNVSDSLLGQTMLLARRALEDTGRDQQYIRTVPRFGYHWHAAVEVESVVATSGQSPGPDGGRSDPDTAGPLVSARRTLALPAFGVAAVLIVLAPFLLSSFDNRVGDAEHDVRDGRLLVRPITVVGAPDMAWFRIGGMALVGDHLRTLGLQVVPSGTVAALADHLGDDLRPERWLQPARAERLVDGRAEQRGERWQVELIVSSGNGRRLAHVRQNETDLLTAAREASQRLALDLGGEAAASSPLMHEDALAREIASALLVGQTRRAAVLIDGADEGQRQAPEIRLAEAHLAWLTGKHELARRRWQTLADELAPDLHAATIAEALNGLGALHFHRGEHARAITVLDQAIATMTDHHPSLGQALNNRALAHSARGDDGAARTDFARARTVLEEHGDSLTQVNVELGSAMHALAHDRLPEALPVLDRAADDFAAFGHRLHELNARMHAARTRWLLLDPTGAMNTVLRLAELEAELAESGWRAYSTLVRSQILLDAGRHSQARTLLEDVLASDEAGRDAALRWQAHALLAALAADTQSAIQHAALAAAGSATGPNQLRSLAHAHLVHARATLALDPKDSTALAAFEHWSATQDEHPVVALYLAIARGETDRARGRLDTAQEHYEEAMRRADAGRVPRDLLVAAAAFVDFLLTTDQEPQARLVTERVAGWANLHFDAALMQLRLYHGLGQRGAWLALRPRVEALAGERPIPPELLVAP